MEYNCKKCEEYWDLLNSQYFKDLKKKGDEIPEGMVLFCPDCRMTNRRNGKTFKHEK
jgi:hypothetical protein